MAVIMYTFNGHITEAYVEMLTRLIRLYLKQIKYLTWPTHHGGCTCAIYDYPIQLLCDLATLFYSNQHHRHIAISRYGAATTRPATPNMRNRRIDLSDTLNTIRVALTRASLEGAVLGGVRPLVLISHPVDG